jgi:hypothetical protein
MPHDILRDYLDRVKIAAMKKNAACVEYLVREILTRDRANLRMRIRFPNGRLLELNEALGVEEGKLAWLDYRYHFQDEHNHLIFRYDNTPHFPLLPGFPEHKHLPERVISASRPDIEQVLLETEEVCQAEDRPES